MWSEWSRAELPGTAAQRRQSLLGRSIGPVAIDAMFIGVALVVAAAVVAWAAGAVFLRVTRDPDEGANFGGGLVFLGLLFCGCAIAGYVASKHTDDHPVMNGVFGAAVGYALVVGVVALLDEPGATLSVGAFYAPLAMGAAVVGAVIANRRHRRGSSGSAI